MAQYHHVVYFDTADEQWHLDDAIDVRFPDGPVWNYAGSREWSEVPELEELDYQSQAMDLVDAANLDLHYDSKLRML